MRKLILTLIILCGFIAVGYTQSKEISPFQAFLNARTMQANFIQENHYPGIDNYSFSGRVYITRPVQALWDYITPEEYYLISPKELFHYNAELKQATKMKIQADSEDLSGLLLGVFIDSKTLYNDFTVKDEGLKIILTPKKNVGVENIVITMAEKSMILESIYTEDFSGNSIRITFSGVEQNVPIDGTVFNKKPPQGTEYFEQ